MNANEVREHVNDWLGEPTKDCPVRSPWITSTPILPALGVLVVEIVAQRWDLPLVHGKVINAAVLGVALGILALIPVSFGVKKCHVHCDGCGVCSRATGVPLTRGQRTLDRLLRAAGWHVADDEDYVLCPACRTAEESDGPASGGVA